MKATAHWLSKFSGFRQGLIRNDCDLEIGPFFRALWCLATMQIFVKTLTGKTITLVSVAFEEQASCKGLMQASKYIE